jgi:hypothetical protein
MAKQRKDGGGCQPSTGTLEPISRHQDVKHLPGQRTGWRRSSCQRFVRDRATRDLAPAPLPNPRQHLSPARLCGYARCCTALRTIRASMARMGSPVRFRRGLHTRLTSGNAGEWPTGAIAADHLRIGRDAPGLSAPRGSGAAAPTPTRWAATAPVSRPPRLRQAHPGPGGRLRRPPHRRPHLLGDHPAPPPACVDHRRGGRPGCAWRCWPPTTGWSAWSWST